MVKKNKKKGILKQAPVLTNHEINNTDMDSSNLIQPNNFDNTFTIYIWATKGNNENGNFTRLQIMNVLLQSFHAADSDTKNILPENDKYQRLNFNTIDTNRNTNINYQRLEKCLWFTSTEIIEGNLIITSMSPYHVFKKIKTQNGYYNNRSR